MLLDDTVNEKAWAQCERQSQEYEIASGRHEPFAGVKPRADVSENERREDGVGGEAQDCAQRSAEEGGAVEGTVRVEEGVCEREIEPRPSEEDAGCNRGDKAAEDERGGKIPNRHSPCSVREHVSPLTSWRAFSPGRRIFRQARRLRRRRRRWS